MAKKRDVYHVTPDGDGWKVKKEGASRASASTGTKKPAIDRAKELAKKAPLGQVIIHKQDGSIQTEYTYGEDPRKRPG